MPIAPDSAKICAEMIFTICANSEYWFTHPDFPWLKRRPGNPDASIEDFLITGYRRNTLHGYQNTGWKWHNLNSASGGCMFLKHGCVNFVTVKSV
jgi:hypothetical protein